MCKEDDMTHGKSAASTTTNHESAHFHPLNSISQLLSSYSNEEDNEEDEGEHDEAANEADDENAPEEELKSVDETCFQNKTKVSTELARRMLQKNLERLLLNHTETCRDVISQLTGTMTPEQVQSLIEKTNGELDVPKTKKKQLQQHSSAVVPASIMKKSSGSNPSSSQIPCVTTPEWNRCCNDCGVATAALPQQSRPLYTKSQMSQMYWTPQTHRKSSGQHRRHHNHRNSSSGSGRHFLKRSELAQSVMLSGATGTSPPYDVSQQQPQKQHQYYSPQVRRKSVDLTLLQNIRECHETSDSSDEELLVAEQLSSLSVNMAPAKRQQQQPAYYGGVHPVYLPNSRLKAKKLQKTPLLTPSCQGCCQHDTSCSLSSAAKSGEDNKKCIIS